MSEEGERRMRTRIPARIALGFVIGIALGVAMGAIASAIPSTPRPRSLGDRDRVRHVRRAGGRPDRRIRVAGVAEPGSGSL